MKDLDWNMFAFLSWLERNKEAHTLDGLMMSDGTPFPRSPKFLSRGKKYI
jgi:hypothetical protein